MVLKMRAFLAVQYVIVACAFIIHLCSGSGYGSNVKCSPTEEYCTNIWNCPEYAELLKRLPIPRPAFFFRVLRKHQCGFVGSDPKVCCRNNSEQNIPKPPNVTHHPNIRLLPQINCGRSNVLKHSRISGGSKAELMEFPWMALLAYDSLNNPDFRCGGTIINDRYVLTAAHCIVDQNLVGVRLGEYDYSSKTDCDANGLCLPTVQDFKIEEMIIHPQYKNDTQENDVGLIRLAISADFTQGNVQPVCLPVGRNSEANSTNKYGIVSGWGVTENGFRSPELRKVTVPIQPIRNCQNLYKNTPVTYKQICAGGRPGKDSCSGDSGGPLQNVIYNFGIPRYVQYGIISYGAKYCGIPEYPGIYTKVIYYAEWILDNLKPAEY